MMNDHETEQLPAMGEIWQSSLNWQPDEQQQQQFQKLYGAVLAGNQQLNLTRITKPDEFWEKHLWDSLSGVKPWLGGQQVSEKVQEVERAEILESEAKPDLAHTAPASPPLAIDIGTGAGFPGVPVAIALPHWQVTLLDSTRKKIAFLSTLLTELQILNAATLVDRAEAVGQHGAHRERYDLALVRAVAPVTVCAEYTLPLLKLDGQAVLYRGQWTAEEADALVGAIAQLGGKLESIESFTTPLTQGIRHCIYLRKVEPTDAQFPRVAGLPNQKPL